LLRIFVSSIYDTTLLSFTPQFYPNRNPGDKDLSLWTRRDSLKWCCTFMHMQHEKYCVLSASKGAFVGCSKRKCTRFRRLSFGIWAHTITKVQTWTHMHCLSQEYILWARYTVTNSRHDRLWRSQSVRYTSGVLECGATPQKYKDCNRNSY